MPHVTRVHSGALLRDPYSDVDMQGLIAGNLQVSNLGPAANAANDEYIMIESVVSLSNVQVLLL